MVTLLLAVIYLAFISLGLPDSLLGSAWPSMYPEFGVNVSWSGIIFFLISAGTVVSSLQSDRLTRRFGAGKVTAVSVLLTAVAMLGFSTCEHFWLLCLWAIPYGLGAGSVDAALNNYVAVHYASRHMSWLHCMWGLGASIGPYIMGWALTRGTGWPQGYRIIGLAQLVLTALLFLSLPLWRGEKQQQEEGQDGRKAMSLGEVFAVPGVKAVAVTFFCYCALEQTTGLWASSYLVLSRGVPAETAASFASLFYIGITLGRALSGFLTLKFSDTQMVRLGQVGIALGLAAMVLPFGDGLCLAGLILVGLGCAPIYPSIIHATPGRFGTDKSQAIIGVQMASAYVGNCLMPPLFGVLADCLSPALLPFHLALILAVMVGTHEKLAKMDANAAKETAKA